MHRLDVPDPQALPFAIGSFDSIGPLARADFPHRHAFYEIVFVTRCQGQHVIDSTQDTLRPPQLAVIAPGQVHYWRVSRIDGYVILFLADFLAAYPGDRRLLHAVSGRSLELDREAARRIGSAVAELAREYANPGPASLGVLQAYLHVLLVRVWRLATDRQPRPVPGRGAAVSSRFTMMLTEPGGHLRTVRDFAAGLGISAEYLTEVVRRETGQTPAYLIRRARVVEAKRLLTSTDRTVVQICSDLGFADPAYFCRFFRRETGLTPGEYRRMTSPDLGKHPDTSI